MKAFYDNKPSVLEAVGNGSYLYRYNIKEVEVESNNTTTDESESTTKRTQWECEEVRVWSPVTSNKITEAAITEKWESNYEQKLVNEYNAAKMGLYSDEETANAKITRYTDYLNERTTLKAQVDADCKELGID